MKIDLYPHQVKAISKMKNGCILCGDVGTGKSRTSIAYFYSEVCKGDLKIQGSMKAPRDLYIITTAKKRDSGEWLEEMIPFCLDLNGVNVVVDSWNNISKYKNVYGAFFIFDEQRVVGYGSWVKSFLSITKKNQWILLTATPGDVWSDYIPVFIANGFYKNKTEFAMRHIIYSRFTNYPKIERYADTKTLVKHRNDILIIMDYNKSTVKHKMDVIAEYDKSLYSKVVKDRWDPYDNCPIKEIGKLCYLIRKVVNSDQSRATEICKIISKRKKVIIFYNFNYELDIIKEVLLGMEVRYSEWNGSCHQPIPEGDGYWVYLVQYSAGAEGWNCITTDTIIFYSLNYSYRMTTQAEGRIDRLNTPYTDLYYYFIKSKSPIDEAISNALYNKQNFNEKTFLGL